MRLLFAVLLALAPALVSVSVSAQEINPTYGTATAARVNIARIATPAAPSVTPQGVTGATTYSYRISCLNAIGETLASTAGTTATGNAVLSSSNFNRVRWVGQPGCASYKVYGRTSGSELLMTTVSPTLTTFDDTGTLTPAGALPAANTTGGDLRPEYLDVVGITTPGNSAASRGRLYFDSGSTTFQISENTGSYANIATDVDTLTFTNKTYSAEGTGNVLTMVEKWSIQVARCDNATASAPAWSFPATDPAVPACATGTNIQRGTLDFADGAATLSAQTTRLLPADFTGTVDAKFVWFTAATSGDVVWQLATICVADAETGDPAFNTASTVTDTAKGTTLQHNEATIATVTITGCAAGETLYLRLFRDPATGADTLAATARLVTFELTFRRAQ